MPTSEHTVTVDQLDLLNGDYICGEFEAVFHYTTAFDYSADIGGADGYVVDHCEFVGMAMGGAVMRRQFLEEAMGLEALHKWEQEVGDEIQGGLNSYDMAAE